VRGAEQAGFAASAALNGHNYHPVTDHSLINAISHRLDRAGELVSQDRRRLHPLVSGIRTIGVQIAAANAAGSDPEKHLPGTRIKLGKLPQASISRLTTEFRERLHGSPLEVADFA
jgi:hypothetical protein